MPDRGQVGVLGSDGLIGRAVRQRLERSCAVVTLGRRPGADRQIDLAERATLASADLTGLDALVHCAGITDEDVSSDLGLAFEKAVRGMDMVAQRARACGVGLVIYVSSAHVYGPLEGRISEDSPANPLRPYAIAHHASEQVLRRHAGESGMRALVLRAGNAYGEPADWERFQRWALIPFSFPEALAKDARIELRTTGQQSLNFVAASDIAEYCAHAIADTGRAPGLEVANAAGAETLTVYDFARQCAEYFEARTGRRGEVVRPEPGPEPPPVPLQFVTRTSLPSPRGRLADFLPLIFDRLLTGANPRTGVH